MKFSNVVVLLKYFDSSQLELNKSNKNHTGKKCVDVYILSIID
jgi:hypothetical protein